MRRWARADTADRENRERAYEDLEFLEPGGQWEAEIKQLRESAGRPCLEFDRLGTTVAQITGDIRQMRPAIKVVAIDDRGDKETAEVRAGIIRYVEGRSDASAIYFAAADQQVPAGVGHWKVITEYGSDSTFEQEIAVAPIPDGIGVRWDPDAVKKTREDAKFCFIPVDKDRAAYEEEYPDHPCEEIGGSDASFTGASDWSTPDVVRLAEYYVKTPVKKRLALMPDGEVRDLTNADPEDLAEAEVMAAQGQARIEVRDGHKIERYLINAREVLEGPVLIPGRFIPVVPVFGVEQVIGKKRTRRGVVRKAKDSQRAYNYSRSTQTEVVALQPKAPFVGTEEQFRGYEDIWATANSENHPFLPYNPDPKAGTAMPQRVPPPVASSGLAELSREAAEDIKGVTGIYDASLGAPSNESSGKAILARQREGDVGSFVYIENFNRAIRHTGAIINSMIPAIYDTARTLRIIGEDGKVDLVKLNQPQGLAVDGKSEVIKNDVTVGAYDVSFEMGASYSTKQQAASDGIMAFIQAAPNAAPLVLDILAKAQDWPLSDKIAKRIRTMLPPQIQAQEAQESGEPPPPPMPPSPQEQAAMQAQERQQQIEAGRLQVDMKKLDVEREKLRNDMLKIQTEADRLIAEAQMGAAQPGAPAADPRLDAIAAAVAQLSEVVSMIMEEMSAVEPPPPAPPAEPEPPMALPADLVEPPPGGFSFDPSALGQPAPDMMGQP
ncbi:portal protein [Methylorubrum populi]